MRKFIAPPLTWFPKTDATGTRNQPSYRLVSSAPSIQGTEEGEKGMMEESKARRFVKNKLNTCSTCFYFQKTETKGNPFKPALGLCKFSVPQRGQSTENQFGDTKRIHNVVDGHHNCGEYFWCPWNQTRFRNVFAVFRNLKLYRGIVAFLAYLIKKWIDSFWP